MNLRSLTREQFLALGNLEQLQQLVSILRPLAADLTRDRNAVLGVNPHVQDAPFSITLAHEEDRGVLVGDSGITAGYVLVMRASGELYGAQTSGTFYGRTESWALATPLRPVELGAAVAWVRARTAYTRMERFLRPKAAADARYYHVWAQVSRGLNHLSDEASSD